MTILEAVNEMLEWIGQPPVTAITAGTDEYEAQTTLTRKTRDVLKRGWFVNEEKEVVFSLPTVKIGISAVTGTFTYGEVVTQTVTSATGYYAYTDSGFMYLVGLSGTFTSGHVLNGGSSAATGTGGTYSAITEAKIPYDTDILAAVPSVTAFELAVVAMRGGFFYDTEENTTTFDDDLTLDIIRLLDFTDLPTALADYVTKEAAYSFMRYKMPARTEGMEQRLAEVVRARTAALQADGDLRKTNLHKTREGRAMLGHRDEWCR